MKKIVFSLACFLALNLRAQVSIGLINHYDFDDATVNDKIGLFNGTNNGATFVADRKGNLNQAIYLDGNSNVKFGDVNVTVPNMTLSFWIKHPAVSSNDVQYVMGKRQVCSTGDFFDVQMSSSSIGMEVYNGSNSSASPAAGGQNLINTWQHVAFVLDQTKGMSYKYVDGILVSSKTWSPKITSIDNITEFVISASPCVGSLSNRKAFVGALDDIRIYNRPINALEVDSLFKDLKPAANCLKANTFISENFNGYVGSLPNCWSRIESKPGSNFHAINVLQTHQANVSNTRYAFSPEVVLGNGKGFLSFDAKGYGGQTALHIGVSAAETDTTSFELTETVTLGTNTKHYVIDFSTYLGTGKYLVFKEIAKAFEGVEIDNVIFSQSAPISASICDNQTYILSGQVFNTTGVFTQTYKDANNQDSIVILDLKVNPTYLKYETKYLCAGANYLMPDGFIYEDLQASFSHENKLLTSLAMCDSILNTNIEIEQVNDVGLNLIAGNVCTGSDLQIQASNTEKGVSYSLFKASNNSLLESISGNGQNKNFALINTSAKETYFVEAKQDVKLNKSKYFDAGTRINTGFSLPTTSTFTFESWIYPTANTYKRIFSNFNGAASAATAGELVLDTYHPNNTSGTSLRFSFEGTLFMVQNVLTKNKWNHIAITFDSGSLKIYVDGTLKDTFTVSKTSFVSKNHAFSIGEDRVVGTNEYFAGLMDEFRIWTKAKTETEIKNSMSNCLKGTEAGLALYYPFNTQNGKIVENLASTTNGTIEGGELYDNGAAIECANLECKITLNDTITVQPVNASAVTLAEELICSPSTNTITISNSVIGFNYVLRNYLGHAEASTYFAGNGGDLEITREYYTSINLEVYATNQAKTEVLLRPTAVVVPLPTCSTTLINSVYVAVENINTDIAMQTDSTLKAIYTAPNTSYQWYDCYSDENGGIILNETNQNYKPKASSTYRVKITSELGCEYYSSCLNYLLNGLEKSQIQSIQVLPNPAQEVIFLDTQYEIENVSIYSTSGILVKSTQDSENSVNISDLQSGVYLIQIETTEGLLMSKFVKE